MRRLLLLAAFLAAFACSNSSPAGPSPVRQIVDLEWVGPNWLRVGESTQLQVIAKWSDGSSEPAANAQWMSHNPKTVEVNVGGRATGMAVGLANLVFTVNGTSRGGQIQVLPKEPLGARVEVRVQMVAPSEHVVFPGLPVRITALGHFPYDQTFTTDAEGRLFVTLDATTYRFQARPLADGPPTNENVAVSGDTRVTLLVRPSAGPAIERLTLARGLPPVDQISATYPVHQSGSFTFGLFRACFDDSCGPTDVADVCAEVRDTTNTLFGQVRLPVGSPQYQSGDSIVAGHYYIVKAYPCLRGSFTPAPGVVFRELDLEVRRPK